MAKRIGKKPKQKVHPSGKRNPRGIKKAEKNEDASLVWDTKSIDTGGRWAWDGIVPRIWWDFLCPARQNFSSMKWSEIVGDRHHPIPVDRIIPDAQKRLSEIESDDVDTLYSLALSNKIRVWGIRDRNIFKVLWWDPEHEIYPTEKGNT